MDRIRFHSAGADQTRRAVAMHAIRMRPPRLVRQGRNLGLQTLDIEQDRKLIEALRQSHGSVPVTDQGVAQRGLKRREPGFVVAPLRQAVAADRSPHLF